ncbi:MAG: hypothetical protein NVS9B1_08860 [Candidatus Dormibacteraceae bacterium]
MNDPRLESPVVQRAIAVLRIFWGLVFLSNGIVKLVPLPASTPFGFLIDSNGARGIIAHDAKHHPVQLYHDLVYNFFIPNWSFIGPLVGISETIAGAMLLFGFGSFLGALLAVGLSLHIQFAALFSGEWLFEYATEWVTLGCLVFLHSGRKWGFDARLAERIPRLARWL